LGETTDDLGLRGHGSGNEIGVGRGFLHFSTHKTADASAEDDKESKTKRDALADSETG